MNLLDNIPEKVRDRKIKPRPSIVLTLRIDNPRFKEVNIDTSKSTPTIDGVFSIDVTNTGIFATRSTRITGAEINIIKGNSTLTVGEINKPQRIESIPGGETKTINITFDRQDTFVRSIVEDVCDNEEVKASVTFTLSEVLLAATYEDTKKLNIESKDCKTISIDISGQSEVNVDQEYDWSIVTRGGDSIGDVTWNMGDGTTLTGQSIQHIYNSTGQNEITVRTSRGYEASKTVSVTIIPVGIVGPTELTVGEEYTWSATGTDVADGTGLTWNTGDGSTYDSAEINHTYTDSGSYNLQLVSDQGSSDETQVEVRYPNVSLENVSAPSSVQTNQDNTFSVTGNNLSTADEIRWDMGDGTILNGTQVEHRYATSGEYTLRVSARIDEETINTAEKDISVETFAF